MCMIMEGFAQPITLYTVASYLRTQVSRYKNVTYVNIYRMIKKLKI